MNIELAKELIQALEDGQCFGDCCWMSDEGVRELLAEGLKSLVKQS